MAWRIMISSRMRVIGAALQRETVVDSRVGVYTVEIYPALTLVWRLKYLWLYQAEGVQTAELPKRVEHNVLGSSTVDSSRDNLIALLDYYWMNSNLIWDILHALLQNQQNHLRGTSCRQRQRPITLSTASINRGTGANYRRLGQEVSFFVSSLGLVHARRAPYFRVASVLDLMLVLCYLLCWCAIRLPSRVIHEEPATVISHKLTPSLTHGI